MKRAFVISGVICIIFGLAILGLVVVPWLVRDDAGFPMGDMDRHFIEQMIPHHEDAVAMAELALTRGEHSELRDLAGRIIQNQSREIGDMQSWYLDWYGTEAPEDAKEFRGFGMMSGGMMHGESDLEVLKAAADFDKEFIQQMIPHHQMGVMMARMVVLRGERQEIEELAETIIETQTSEIELMRDWYDDWYE